MQFITLMTDFGLRDGFVGVMKGVILGIASQAQIADLSHDIGAQDVLQGAFVLGRSVGYFPPGTVHVAVVDPGVGTQRRPVACRVGDAYCVGPDNGLFTYLFQQAERLGAPLEVVRLDRPEYWLPEISHVFHGRDIFAPVAAHLANGVPLSALGTPVQDAVRLELPPVEVIPGGLRGRVALIDYFGNLLTNIERQHLAPFGERRLRVRLCGVEIEGLVVTFGSRPSGELVALFGEADDLQVSVVNGNARERLGAQVGDLVEVLGG
jgi:hypothetical protein